MFLSSESTPSHPVSSNVTLIVGFHLSLDLLRPRCIGPGKAQTQILFYSILSLDLAGGIFP